MKHAQTKIKNPFTQGGRLTLYGRKPVLEALQDHSIIAQRLFLSYHAEGGIIKEISALARDLGVPVERMSAMELSRISKQGKQDQGVALDVQAPHHESLESALERLKATPPTRPIFLLDGVQTPANLGMILRSLCAAGVEGVILPKRGCAPLNPLAIKASAGVAIKAPVWGCETAHEAAEALSQLGLPLFGLRGEGAQCLFTELSGDEHTNALTRGVWVLGNESEGVSAEVGALITTWVSLPMEAGVESLNAAVAASVVSFELTRRRLAQKAK